MPEDKEEMIRKRVGGSMRNIPIMRRVESLRENARFLRKQSHWTPPADDGTLIRKTVGASR